MARNPSLGRDRRKTFVDKCFKDRSGQVVLGQDPNKWLYIWVGTLFVAAFSFLVSITAFKFLSVISLIFLAIWAGLELFQGINYFRRALGLLAIAGAIAAIFTVIRI